MKTAKIFTLGMAALLFASCDYNEKHFDGLDEASRPRNVVSYEYEITSADVTTIVSALRANKNSEDSLLAAALNTSKAFSASIPSNRLIPYVLKALYYSADPGSSAKVTFPYLLDRDESLVKLSQPSYVLTTNDYQQIWGSATDYVSALTPAKSPATVIPSLLAERKSEAVSGDYAIVQYNYSAEESGASPTVRYDAYQFSGTAWRAVAASANVLVLQAEDYTAMGLTNLSTTQAPNYLPALLAQKYPFAQEGNERTIVFRTSSSANYANIYTFAAGKWTPKASSELRIEQYIVSPEGWIFDPTIVLTVKRYQNTDAVQRFISYVAANLEWYPYPGRTNEEHYYGFNAYYGEIVFDNNRTLYGDAEIKNLTTNEEKWALFDSRLEIAFPIFAAINYPDLQTHVSGVEQLLKVRIEHYYSSSDRRFFEHTLRCVKSGSEGSPAEFEYLGKEQIPAL
jgi:hypothetical protein